MNKRILNKKIKEYRCQFIADKIGTEHRTNWVKYFKKHPGDLALVKRFLKQAERESLCKHGTYVSTLCHDMRTNYVNPGFKESSAAKMIELIENGDYIWYIQIKNRKFMGISMAASITVNTLKQI